MSETVLSNFRGQSGSIFPDFEGADMSIDDFFALMVSKSRVAEVVANMKVEYQLSTISDFAEQSTFRFAKACDDVLLPKRNETVESFHFRVLSIYRDVLQDIQNKDEEQNYNNNNNNSRQNVNERSKKQRYIINHKLKNKELKRILQCNGLSTGGNRTELISRIINTPNVDMHIDVPPPNVHSRGNNISENDDNQNLVENDDTENLVENDDTENIVENDDTDNIEQLEDINEKKKKKARNQLKQEIVNHQKLLENIQEIIEDPDATEILNKLITSIKSIKKQYEPVPRRTRSKYVNNTNYISDARARNKQFAAEITRITQRLYELSCQTQSFVALLSANTNVGQHFKSIPKVWISTAAQQVSLDLCINIKSSWDDLIAQFINDRNTYLNNYGVSVLKRKISVILECAQATGASEVIQKAQQLELGHLLSNIQRAGIDINILAEADEQN